MYRDHHDHDRRRFLRMGLFGAAAVPFVAVLLRRQANAQESQPRLDEDAPEASALDYTHDADEVDSPPREDGAVCANCQLYTGDRDAEWGGCAAFPGKDVAAAGWCAAWVETSG